MITKKIVHILKRIDISSLKPFKFQISINENINILKYIIIINKILSL